MSYSQLVTMCKEPLAVMKVTRCSCWGSLSIAHSLLGVMALFSFRLILQYFLSFLIDLIPSLKLTLYIKVDPNDFVGDMYIFPWGQIDYFFHHAYES